MHSIDHLADFLSQTPRTPAEEWLQDGFARWLKDGDRLPPHRCLGLPATPTALRRLMRNRKLRQAAKHLDGEEWARAGALLEQVRLFDLRRWPVWHRLEVAPPHATPIQAALFDAFKTGASMPKTHESYHGILLGD